MQKGGWYLIIRGMTTEHMIPEDLRQLYQVKEWRNAAGVLATACQTEWQDVMEVLRNFRLLSSEILTSGGGLPPTSRQINLALDELGWQRKTFDVRTLVDGETRSISTIAVDCSKGRVAIELEWNNKDVFFDRDLSNFRTLYDVRAIDSAVIITRSADLQKIFVQLGRSNSYGSSTTHHGKLWPRLESGAAGGCPVLAFAISPALYTDDGPDAAKRAQTERAATRIRPTSTPNGVSPGAGWEVEESAWS